MVQFRILSGKKAGVQWVARRFPVRVGRALGADLQLEEDGVWDEHFQLAFRSGEGFVMTATGEALTSVNGEPCHESLLRNGDIIEAGGAKLQFWLAEARSRGLRAREVMTWAGIAAVFLVQIGLLYWLLS
jgi:pSer/pThr/pTyr-binding forkhead associated (FHA) protein